jgi:LPXTG-motif cell wall-anchored protein
MAATSASRSWAFARRALAASAVAAVGLIATAIPASAHNNNIQVGCDEETGKTSIAVNLTKYSDKGNTLKITDNGAVLVEKEFGGSTSFEKKDLPGDVEHVFKIVVKATDGDQYNVDQTRTVKACKEKEQPPTQPNPPTQPPAPTNPPAQTTPTTTTTPVAVGANANLAETGASIALPIGIGALLLVGGAVLLFVMRKRGRA